MRTENFIQYWSYALPFIIAWIILLFGLIIGIILLTKSKDSKKKLIWGLILTVVCGILFILVSIFLWLFSKFNFSVILGI
ncbi:MAG: hypothetical protein V1663_04460 [archaeon]